MSGAKALRPLNEHDAKVLELWNLGGASAADIGAPLGKSRNSILSTVHRLKKLGHFVVERPNMNRSSPKTKAKPAMQESLRRKPQPKVPPRTKPAAPETEDELGPVEPFVDRQASIRAPGAGEGVPFAAASGLCQWPLWGQEYRVGNVCGADLELVVIKGVKKPRGAYCEFHGRHAWHNG